MTAAARPVAVPPSGERFARRVVTGCAVLVVAACFGFSFGNVLALGQHLGVPPYVAWLIAPAVVLAAIWNVTPIFTSFAQAGRDPEASIAAVRLSMAYRRRFG